MFFLFVLTASILDGCFGSLHEFVIGDEEMQDKSTFSTQSKHQRRRLMDNDGYINDDDKLEFLNLHNDYRSSLSSGDGSVTDINGDVYPKSSNMNSLFWDNSLALLAQSHANWLADTINATGNDCGGLIHNYDRNTQYFDKNYDEYSTFTSPSETNGIVIGENIASTWWSLDLSLLTHYTDRIDDWWSTEHGLIDYGTLSIAELSSAGHFTQMAWADTRYVGCGARKCYDGSYWYKWFLVCNYYPAGNYINQIPYEPGNCTNGDDCECDEDRTKPGENSLCSGCMDPDYTLSGSTSNSNDCDNGLGVIVDNDNPSLSPTNEPTVEPSDNPSLSPTNEPTIEPSDIPSNEPTIATTFDPNEIIITNRDGTQIGPWYYSCKLDQIANGYTVNELCISNDNGNVWECGTQVTWSPYWWIFSGLGLSLPYDIKITSDSGEVIIVYDVITNFIQGEQFGTGQNFGNELMSTTTMAPENVTSMVIVNRDGTTIGPWFYSCLINNIGDGFTVSELCISDNGGSNWYCGSQVSWSPYWWTFSGFGQLNLPYDVKITEIGGQTIILYDLITTYVASDEFDTQTNFQDNTYPTLQPSIESTTNTNGMVIISRNGDTSMGPYWYSCMVDNVSDGHTVTELCISDNGGTNWHCGTQVTWSPYWWIFSGFGKLNLPYDVRITSSTDQSIIAYDIITNYNNDEQFDVGQNF